MNEIQHLNVAKFKKKHGLSFTLYVTFVTTFIPFIFFFFVIQADHVYPAPPPSSSNSHKNLPFGSSVISLQVCLIQFYGFCTIRDCFMWLIDLKNKQQARSVHQKTQLKLLCTDKVLFLFFKN